MNRPDVEEETQQRGGMQHHKGMRHVRDNRALFYALAVCDVGCKSPHDPESDLTDFFMDAAPPQPEHHHHHHHDHSKPPPPSPIVVVFTILEYVILIYCSVDVCRSPCLITFYAEKVRGGVDADDSDTDGLVMAIAVEYGYALP